MTFLTQIFLGNPVYQWLLALVVALAIFGAAQISKNFVNRRIVNNALTGNNIVVMILTQTITQTRGYFLVVIAIYAASLFLDLSTRLENVLRVTAITIFLLQVGFWGTSFINTWINYRMRQELERNNTNATTLGGLGMVLRIVFWLVLILLILENITGMQMNSLIASLGITGVAVALAVQNILSDLFASLSITLDRPFVIGDSIVVGEFSGEVEHIGLKSTRIRSLTGEQLIFSNSDLLNSRIRNYKRMERRRVVFQINLRPSTDPALLERVPELIADIVGAQPQVTFDRAHFKDILDTAMRFEVVYYIETPDYLTYMNTQQAINLQVLRRFAAEDIDFAFITPVALKPENA